MKRRIESRVVVKLLNEEDMQEIRIKIKLSRDIFVETKFGINVIMCKQKLEKNEVRLTTPKT